MKQSKQCFIMAFSIFYIFIASCATSTPTRDIPKTEGLDEKLNHLKKISQILVHGDIILQKSNRKVQGNFVLSVKGDDIDMQVFSKGISVGEITLENNKITMSPSLNNEYLDYMFAVVVRDSITWWNIYDYAIKSGSEAYILKNSWKKVYIDSFMLVPVKQIFSLRWFKKVDVDYSKIEDFGFGLLPSQITFSYKTYDCMLSVGRIEIIETKQERQDQGLLQLS